MTSPSTNSYSLPSTRSLPTSLALFRAEVIQWDELLALGSWNKAKEVGKLRVEGKEYEFVDGDVTEFRFNV